MKNLIRKGDIKIYKKRVTEADTAKFESGKVHDLYATFALGRDAEWCTRLFVLDIKDDDEEGIGTFLEIDHISPALTGSEITITATLELIVDNKIECGFDVKVGDRLIAKGRTGQKILEKARLEKILSGL